MKANVIVVALAMLVSLSLNAGVVYVDSTAKGAGDGSSWTDAFTSLRAAVDASAASDELRVAEGTYYAPADTAAVGANADPIVLKDNMHLVGGYAAGGSDLPDAKAHPTILDGDFQKDGVVANNSGIVLSLSAGARVDGFVLKRGYQGDKTVSLLRFPVTAAAASATVANCIFRDNVGIVYADDAATKSQTLTFSGCEFRNNAGVEGAVLYCSNYNTIMYVRGCEFSGNVATNGACCYGTGNFGRNNTAEEFHDCVFSNNIAEVSGGVFCSVGSPGGPSFFGCHFTNNCAKTGSGGAILNTSLYRWNYPMVISNCVFGSNWAGLNGGALQLTDNSSSSGNTYQIFKTIFIDNEAKIESGDGGGGAIGSECANLGYRLKCWDCTFVANRAPNRKGGAVFWGNVGYIWFYRSKFIKNSAGANGAAIFTQYGTSDSVPYFLYAEDCVFDRNQGGLGAVYWDRHRYGAVPVIRFVRTVFTGNSAMSGGAVVNASSYHETSYALTNVFENCLFAGNSAVENGGATRMIGTRIYKSCTFGWNSAQYGGALAEGWGTTVFSNTVFHANTSTAGGDELCEWHSSGSGFGNRIRTFVYCAFDRDPGEYQLASENVMLGVRYSGMLDVLTVTKGEGMVYRAPRLVGDTMAVAAGDDAARWTERSRLASQNGHWTGSVWQKDTVTSKLIDAGPTAWSVGDEPMPNGDRINMGFDAGLASASKHYRAGFVILYR